MKAVNDGILDLQYRRRHNAGRESAMKQLEPGQLGLTVRDCGTGLQ